MTTNNPQPTKNEIATRFAYVAVVTPAVLTLAALALQLRWLPETPDPIATHWSGSGPDRSGSHWTYPLITLFMGFGLSAWLWATALPRLRRGARGWAFRFLAATAVGFSAFAAVSMTWSVGMQRGLASWSDAPSVLPAIVTGLVVGLGAALVGWLVLPKQAITFNALPSADIDLAETERAVWLGSARASRGAVATIIIAIVLVAAGAVAAWTSGDYAVMWIFLGLAVLLTALALTTMEADVRVDSNGVEVRGPAGFPRSRVPIAEVASADSINVEPLGSFGGWGWRRVPGAMGVVLRGGEALRVERKEGHALVVTVDDSATAAALLTALAKRAQR